MTENATTTMTGLEFRQALRDLGWSQAEFAARTNIGPTAVNRWIRNYVPVPGWAAAHVRLLLAADQFHREHVAPRKRHKTADQVDQKDHDSIITEVDAED